MDKQIWLPDSKTHVLVENGQVKVWDSMIITRQDLNKSTFGLAKEKEKE
jgi:hypothetical protein